MSDAPAPNLREQAIRGVKWNAIGMVLASTVRLGTVALLAHLLGPDEFGLMGMVAIVTGFAVLFSDMGLGMALIQRQDVEREHLSTIYWATIGIALVLYAILLLVRGLAADFFGAPELREFIVWSGLTLVVASFGQVFSAMLRKELRFDRLAMASVIGALAYAATAITMAIMKMGVLSLIAGQIALQAVQVLVYATAYVGKWMPERRFVWSDLRNYWRFSAFQTGERLANYATANVDVLMIGRYLGAVPLGYYSLSYQVIRVPVQQVTPVLSRVAYPVLSKTQQDDARVGKALCRMTNLLAMVSFPILGGVIVVAPELVACVLGAKWLPAINVVRLFAGVAMLKTLMAPNGSVLLARGRADISFYWNVSILVILIVALRIGSFWGINGVAAALLLVHVPLYFVLQRITMRLISLPRADYWAALREPLFCAVVMMAVALSSKLLLAGMGDLSVFIVTPIVGATVYIALYYTRNKADVRELLRMLRSG